MLKGQFIEDMEDIMETYKRRFTHYSCEYNFKGIEKAKGKMQDYANCIKKMEKVLSYIDKL